jgi:hypothetical protein
MGRMTCPTFSADSKGHGWCAECGECVYPRFYPLINPLRRPEPHFALYSPPKADIRNRRASFAHNYTRIILHANVAIGRNLPSLFKSRRLDRYLAYALFHLV